MQACHFDFEHQLYLPSHLDLFIALNTTVDQGQLIRFFLSFFTSWKICLQHFWCNTLVSISSTGVVNVQAIKNKAELKVGRDGLGPLTTSYPINPCGLSIEYSSTPNVFYLVFVCKLLLFFFLPLTKWILEREMEVEVGLTTSWDINHIWPLPIIVG